MRCSSVLLAEAVVHVCTCFLCVKNTQSASLPFPPLADRVKGMEQEPKSNSARGRLAWRNSISVEASGHHPLSPLLQDWPGRALEVCRVPEAL